MNKQTEKPRFTPRPWHPALRRVRLWALLLGLLSGIQACQKAKPTAAATAQTVAYFTCPMHPQVQQVKPGSCPICHMDLVPQRPIPAASSATAAAPDLQLSFQQMALANITVQTITPAPLPAALPTATPLTGTIVADASRMTSVSSRVAGRVEHLFVRQTGQLLRRGQPLFSVYSEELQTLQREYRLALAQADKSGPPYQQLAAATAQKLQLLGLTTNQINALAQTGRILPAVTYYSPQTGTVQTLNVVQGQYVAEGFSLLTLSDLSSVWVEAQLYPAETSRLLLGQTVTVQVPGERALRGKIIFLNPELTGSSQTTLARIAVPNPNGQLRPGTQANVLLAKSAASPAPGATLLLPPAAIVHDGAASYIWRQTGNRQFRRVRVQTSPGTATSMPLQPGLPPGSQVVITGTYLLESEFTLRQGAANDHMSGMAM